MVASLPTGEPEDGWQYVPLASLLTEHGLKSSGSEEVHSVSVAKGLINQIEHLGRSYAAADTSNYNLVLPGDIVYTKSPTGDFPLGVVKRSAIDYNAIVSPLYGVFTPKSDELGRLIDKLFSDPSFSLRYLSPLVFKGAKNTINVTNDQFISGKFPVPSSERMLHKIIDFIVISDQEIAIAEKLIRSIRSRNDGIMQSFLASARDPA